MKKLEYVAKVQVSDKVQIPKPIREALGGVEHGDKVRIEISKEGEKEND